jgi:putative endopeptidase
MKKIIILSMAALAGMQQASFAQAKKGAKKAPKIMATSKSALPAGAKYIDPKNMNTAVKPVDNFYEYANGAWLAANSVPASETRWGSFNILNEFTQNAVKSILEETAKTSGAKGSAEQMVGDFYASGMNTNAIEAAGIQAISPQLAKINSIKNYDDLINYLAYSQRAGLGGIFAVYVGADDKDVTKNVCNMFQGGLGLPDKDYYFKTDERSVKIQNGYKDYIKNLMKVSGSNANDADEASAMIYLLEKNLAQHSMGRVEMRDPNKMYNKMTLEALSAKTDGFDWVNFFKNLKMGGQKEVIVAQPEFMENAAQMLKSVGIADWKRYLTFHIISNMAPYLSSKFENTRFDFYGKILRGQKEQKPRWKRVSAIVDGGVGMEIGKIYVKKYFTKEAKERMLVLVNNLQDVYRERIEKLEWMSPVTKQKAVEKLNTFIKKIGFPDNWRSYQGLSIDKNNYVQNILNSNEFDYNYNIDKLGKPVDRTEWGMTPPTINAYYNPAYNEIVFPAGILQFPFFDFGADDAVNYGGIGAVIGHEMTHGFDDQGAQYAADGNLKDWWTEEDKTKFKVKTDAIVSQYNGYTVLDTMHVNGELTQGENIADLGGVTIAYDAFKRTKQFKEAKTIDGFTPEQRFFLSWAQVWRANTTAEEAASRISTDPHSPGIHRCNGPLTNFLPFYKAFGLKPGDKMYKNEAERLAIW